MSERYLLTNATVVAPYRVLDGGTVVVEDGLIAEVSPRSYLPAAGDVDLGGRLLMPGIVTGFALAFARALGEYGSVVFVSGNMPYKTEIAPVLIVARLQEFAYGEATAIAVVLLAISFVMLLLINLLERWSKGEAAHA